MESVGSAQSTSESSLEVKLSNRPNLLVELSDLWVKSGEMAEFSCLFDGQPFTAVVWDHNGQSLVDTQRVVSSQTGGLLSLVIQGVGVADQGLYRCTATNQHGQNSSSAQLTVEGGESFFFCHSLKPLGPYHCQSCSSPSSQPETDLLACNC